MTALPHAPELDVVPGSLREEPGRLEITQQRRSGAFRPIVSWAGTVASFNVRTWRGYEARHIFVPRQPDPWLVYALEPGVQRVRGFRVVRDSDRQVLLHDVDHSACGDRGTFSIDTTAWAAQYARLRENEPKPGEPRTDVPVTRVEAAAKRLGAYANEDFVGDPLHTLLAAVAGQLGVLAINRRQLAYEAIPAQPTLVALLEAVEAL